MIARTRTKRRSRGILDDGALPGDSKSVMGTCTWTRHRHRNTGETANVTSGKRLMRSVSSGSMALVLATLTTEAWAQSGAENALESHAQGSMPLSAAIADLRRSPFYTSESLVPLGNSMPRHLWAPLATGSRGSAIRSAPNDSTFSTGRVFLASFGAAALSDVVAFGFALCWAYGGGYGCPDSDAISLIGAITTPVLGTAAGARLAEAPFLPALAGSALGFGVVLGILPAFDPDDHAVLYFAIPSIVQAGITTLVASRFN